MGNLGYETGAEQEGLAAQASARAQDAASVAQEKATELREQGTSKLKDQIDTRSNELGSQMRSAAHALRQSTSNLRNEGNTGAANMTGQLADRVERLGSYLEGKTGDEVVRDVENLARRRPWMLAGVGLLAGLAASRFVKASSEGRYSSARSMSGYRGGYEPLPYDRGGTDEWPERRSLTPPASAPPVTAEDAPLSRDPAQPFGTV